MKKTFKTFALMLLAAFAFSSCVDVPAPFELPGNSSNSSGTASASSKENPLNITQAKSASGNNYVKGYIVGYVDGQKLAEGATFAVPTAAETEILLAETPDETNPDNVLPVQLPPGDVRNALELFAHPEYLKKEVLLYGSLEKYFSVQGMKSTSWGSINGITFGKDPEESNEGNTETGTPEGEGTLASPWNVAAVNIAYAENSSFYDANKEYYIKGIVTQVVKFNSNYGSLNYYISDDATASNKFYVYSGLGLNQAQFTGTSDLNVGDEVVVCGKFTVYQGTFEFQYNNYIVSLNSQGGQGGGEGGGNEGGETVTDLVNGNFEDWVSDSEATGWKSASSASSATVSKSTDARNGSYACNIAAPGTANKRLATQEITLQAGNYTFSFYAKSTTADVCQTRAGYVPVTSGAVGSYKYGDYININNTDWTLVSYDFELTSPTTLCLLVMNPKGSSYSVSQDILVDDAALVKH